MIFWDFLFFRIKDSLMPQSSFSNSMARSALRILGSCCRGVSDYALYFSCPSLDVLPANSRRSTQTVHYSHQHSLRVICVAVVHVVISSLARADRCFSFFPLSFVLASLFAAVFIAKKREVVALLFLLVCHVTRQPAVGMAFFYIFFSAEELLKNCLL